VGETIRDLQAAGSRQTGLTVAEVDQRRRVVGPNSIEMPPPVVGKVIFDEFCKPFYTYQLFMILSCTYHYLYICRPSANKLMIQQQ
jgi:Cation transporter/ATPase, N-terminus